MGGILFLDGLHLYSYYLESLGAGTMGSGSGSGSADGGGVTVVRVTDTRAGGNDVIGEERYVIIEFIGTLASASFLVSTCLPCAAGNFPSMFLLKVGAMHVYCTTPLLAPIKQAKLKFLLNILVTNKLLPSFLMLLLYTEPDLATVAQLVLCALCTSCFYSGCT